MFYWKNAGNLSNDLIDETVHRCPLDSRSPLIFIPSFFLMGQN